MSNHFHLKGVLVMLETINTPNAKRLFVESPHVEQDWMKYYDADSLLTGNYKTHIMLNVQNSHKLYAHDQSYLHEWVVNVGYPIVTMNRLYDLPHHLYYLRYESTDIVRQTIKERFSKDMFEYYGYQALHKRVWGDFIGKAPVDPSIARQALIKSLDGNSPMWNLGLHTIVREVFPQETERIERTDLAHRYVSTWNNRKYLYQRDKLIDGANLRLLFPSHIQDIVVSDAELGEMYDLVKFKLGTSDGRLQVLQDVMTLKVLSASHIFYDSDGLHLLPPNEPSELRNELPDERNF